MENINIITSRPVIDEYDLTSTDPSEYYYNAPGDGTDPTGGKGKLIWDKAKGIWTQAKDAGLVDAALAFLKNRGQGRNLGQNQPVLPPLPPPPPPPKEMSVGLKIGLIVGGVAVVGAVLYFLLRDKKAPMGQVTNVGSTGV
jgi:hypothetical protein